MKFGRGLPNVALCSTTQDNFWKVQFKLCIFHISSALYPVAMVTNTLLMDASEQPLKTLSIKGIFIPMKSLNETTTICNKKYFVQSCTEEAASE